MDAPTPVALGQARPAAPTRRMRSVAACLFTRQGLVWAAATVGLLAYNWWLLVPLRPGLMRSPNELFSNLEVTGQPFALAMQRADTVAGMLLLVAFVAAGAGSIPGGRREWLAMTVFAVAGSVGGLFPQTCPDQVSATCRRLEWTFGLPLHTYVHAVAGIAEFGAITLALLWAMLRTHAGRTASARIYRALTAGVAAAYPLFGLSYLLARLGGVLEAFFFTGFTVVVVTQLAERTASQVGPPDTPVIPG